MPHETHDAATGLVEKCLAPSVTSVLSEGSRKFKIVTSINNGVLNVFRNKN